MTTITMHSRDIFSLSNEEIIKLVDFIFNDHNLNLVANSLFDKPFLSVPDCNYRKIEVCSAHYDYAYVVKVTFGFNNSPRKISTGFLIAIEGGPGDERNYKRDIYIQSVSGFFKPMEGRIWEKGIVDDYGIDLDFSIFQIYIQKLNSFLMNTLKLWSNMLTLDSYEWNPQLKLVLENNDSFIVDELTILSHAEAKV